MFIFKSKEIGGASPNLNHSFMNYYNRNNFIMYGVIVIAAFLISLYIILLNSSNMPFSSLLTIGSLFLLVLLSIYLGVILRYTAAAIPFIICSLWIINFEPAPCDIFALLAIITLIVNILMRKNKIPKPTFPEIMFVLFIISNISLFFYTDGIKYSLQHFATSLYLVGLFLLLSILSDSYERITKHLNLYFIPVAVCFIVLFIGFVILQFFPEQLGFLRDLIMYGNRPKGFFKDPNVAGPFFIPAAIFSLLTILKAEEKSNFKFSLLFILSSSGVFLTLSRGAIISLLLSVFLAILFSFNRKNAIKVFVICAFCFTFLFGFILISSYSKYSERIFNKQFGVEERVERLKMGLKVAKESPLFGMGLIGFKERSEPHDTYLLVFKRVGIIGMFCFWLPILYLIMKLLISSKHCLNEDRRIIHLALAISLISFSISGVAVSFLHWRHFWIIAGLASAVVRLSNNTSQEYALSVL
jgi:hypothetical protein